MAESEKRSKQDVGQDEFWATLCAAHGSNVKRLVENALNFDQDVLGTSGESIKRNRAIVDKIISDAQQNDNQRQVMANQALQNAIETANMVSKQAIRHSDIAIDRQWNVDEQGYTAEHILGQPYVDAIKAAVAAAVAEALTSKK